MDHRLGATERMLEIRITNVGGDPLHGRGAWRAPSQPDHFVDALALEHLQQAGTYVAAPARYDDAHAGGIPPVGDGKPLRGQSGQRCPALYGCNSTLIAPSC